MRLKLLVTVSVLIIFILIDILFEVTHGDGWWADIPGFFAILAIAGCSGIILIAKLLGDKWLRRKEDYYDSD